MRKTLLRGLVVLLAGGLVGCDRPLFEGNEPGECEDGIDNDGDGQEDCLDSGCVGAPVCNDEDAEGGDGVGTDDDDSGSDDDDTTAADDDDTTGDDDDTTGDDDDSAGPPPLPDLPADASIHFGDVTIASEAEAEAFCSHYDTVVGSLHVLGASLSQLEPLACLRWVEGDVRVSATALVALSLPELATVSGGLLVEDNEQLQVVDLPELVVVGGDLAITGQPLLTSYDLQRLVEVGEDLTVAYVTALSELGLPWLRAVGGDLWVRHNDLLTSFTAELLETVGGMAWVSSNASLSSVNLASLTTTGGELYFGRDPELESIVLPLVQSTGGLRISSNARLDTLELPSLFEVWGEVGDVRVSSNSVLLTLSLPGLQIIADHFFVAGNDLLESFQLSQLDIVGGTFYVIRNPSLPTSAAEALRDSVGPEDIGNEAIIEDNGPG
ncbi:MAG: hypothetical protein CL928_06770 [Deltaproteobacteria bacterium]|nr:hypothetical protein [Deltaproteobacteria bacterium]